MLCTSQQYDDQTEQYYLRARYYNPILGRFMQEDTYWGDGLNLYKYCYNNPVMYCDPSGYTSSCNDSNIADQGSVTQVEYGSTDLSQQALDYRRRNEITNGRNVAVFEYELDGQLYTLPGVSVRFKGHAERLIAKELERMGIPASKVKRVYSELEPCSLPFAYCMNFLRKKFPQADITYSFEYGSTVESRRSGLKALKETLQLLFGGK